MDIYGNYGRPNNYYSSMPNQAYSGNYAPQTAQPQMRTNKLYVTSLEDALNRYADPNTVMVYRHQDEQLEFEITTDAQGKKNYKTFVLGDYLAQNQTKPQEQIVNPSEDIKRLEGRIKALEDEVLKGYKDEKRKEKNGGVE